MRAHSLPHLDLAARSCVGLGAAARSENQDNYLTIDGAGWASFLFEQAVQRRRVPGWPAGHVRAAVLDGMGGHGHGRQAAEAAVEALLTVPACTVLADLEARLDALHLALQDSFAQRASRARRPGTTLTLLEVPPAQAALLYHVGDSRLYRIDATGATPLTVDHVPATAFAMEGVLGEREWWQQVHGEHRAQISQAFILGNAFANPALLSDPLYPLTRARLPAWLAALADRRTIALDTDALYLLASDGFWSCPQAQDWIARWPAILAAQADCAGAVAALFNAIASAPPPGLQPDNLTALALRVRVLQAADETALPEADDA